MHMIYHRLLSWADFPFWCRLTGQFFVCIFPTPGSQGPVSPAWHFGDRVDPRRGPGEVALSCVEGWFFRFVLNTNSASRRADFFLFHQKKRLDAENLQSSIFMDFPSLISQGDQLGLPALRFLRSRDLVWLSSFANLKSKSVATLVGWSTIVTIVTIVYNYSNYMV